jgi:DNA-binding CsgD family transcriptional regulator
VLDLDLMVSGWNRAWATCVGGPAGLDEASLDEVIAPCPGIVDCRNWARLARPERPPFMQIGVKARQAAQEQFEGELLVVSGVQSDISLLLLVTREAASQTAGVDGTTLELSYLTSRERQICELLAKGQSGPAIALTLGVSPATVQAHVRNAMAKSGARTRTGLVAMALADGLIAA